MQEDEKKKDAFRDFQRMEDEAENTFYAYDADGTDDAGDFEDFRVDTGGIFEEDEEEELFASLNESLMRQVAEELDGGEDTEKEDGREASDKKKMGKIKKTFLVIGCVFMVLILGTVSLAVTKPGQKIAARLAAKFISVNVNHKELTGILRGLFPMNPKVDGGGGPTEGGTWTGPVAGVTPVPEDAEEVRKEDYVKNILIFGIDQGDMDSVHSGSLNTDTIMIATLNTKDKKVKITSILRDMYVELDDGVGRKLNSIYAVGRRDGQGPELLMHTIENYFKIDLMGYAYVKLAAFEDVVDILGGVSIELSAKEARYLNTTNYITNPKNRNLKTGVNHMNGNQVAGYCRIRKVETIGGAANDYGRTLRQRRVLQAIFQKYKSQSLFDLLPVTQRCLSLVTTNLTEAQISELLTSFIDCGISELESYRLPINDSFYDSGKKGYNGVTYGLVINDEAANVLYLYEELYADTPEEAQANYNELKH